MSKQKRSEKVVEIIDMIKDKSLVFVDYKGINVADFDKLRNELRSQDARIKIFKNTLTLRALDGLHLDVNETVKKVFTQMTAIAVTDSEKFMATSKGILNAEKKKRVKIKGGVFNGEFVGSELVRKYASIPGRQDLYAIIVATLQQVIGNIVYVLEEIKKQKESQ